MPLRHKEAFEKEACLNFAYLYGTAVWSAPPRRHDKGQIKPEDGAISSTFLYLRNVSLTSQKRFPASYGTRICNNSYAMDKKTAREFANGFACHPGPGEKSIAVGD